MAFAARPLDGDLVRGWPWLGLASSSGAKIEKAGQNWWVGAERFPGVCQEDSKGWQSDSAAITCSYRLKNALHNIKGISSSFTRGQSTTLLDQG